MNLKIRKATEEDVPTMLRLIKELAEFEKAPHEVDNTEARMLDDGFRENPVFGAYLAEVDNEIAGMSLYFYRYSTWKGKRLFLEDLIVTEKHRGKNIGTALFEETMKHAVQHNCSGMAWQVLDWNTSAINFYKKYNTSLDPEWINCSLSLSQLEKAISINTSAK